MVPADENIIVNGLWIGDQLSPLELLTLSSFVANGHRFHLWLYEPVKNALPDGVVCMDADEIIPKEKIFRYRNKDQFGHGKGSLGGFSDIFRYKLLYDKGGWWTDMDVTCLKQFDFADPYVFRSHQDLPLVGNIIKCPKGSDLMKACYETAVAEIDENNTDWHRPILILADEVKRKGLDIYIRSISNNDCWYSIKKMYCGRINIPGNWYAIHWVNEEWRKNRVNKSMFVKGSLYGKLLEKYSVKAEDMPVFAALIFRIANSRIMIKARYKLKA